MGGDRGDNARLLAAAATGNPQAAAQLLPKIYSDLRALAASYLRRERPGHTLQPTALVHDAYLRLVQIERVDWQGKTHFFAMAAREMRRVLVDHARHKHADKRGGELERVTLAEDAQVVENRVVDILALDEALRGLEQTHPRRSRIAELRIFGGLQLDEIAEAVGASERAVKEDWRMARAQIGRSLGAS